MPVKVLIVDDQEPFREAARMVVEVTDGFEVVGEAETGEQGVEAARELHPDLVLMDVNLPGIEGPEATRRILAESPDVVVFLVSTYDPAEAAWGRSVSPWGGSSRGSWPPPRVRPPLAAPRRWRPGGHSCS